MKIFEKTLWLEDTFILAIFFLVAALSIPPTAGYGLILRCAVVLSIFTLILFVCGFLFRYLSSGVFVAWPIDIRRDQSPVSYWVWFVVFFGPLVFGAVAFIAILLEKYAKAA
jgi:hypothetical protein